MPGCSTARGPLLRHPASWPASPIRSDGPRADPEGAGSAVIIGPVDPRRKRRLRLGVALGVAVLLATALMYVSFSATPEARQPSEVLAAGAAGQSYELTGRVVSGSIERRGNGLAFEIRDREGGASVPVRYSGIVPDPFREGREVIVTGAMHGERFVAEQDSLVTKCPSKFTNSEQASS